MTWPPLRPDAPQPGCSASTTRTSTPASARCNDAESPRYPAPMTSTRARFAPSSGITDGAATAVSSQTFACRVPASIGYCFRLMRPATIALVTRRRYRPDHFGFFRVGVAIAMCERAGKAEAVAGFEQEYLPLDPQLELAADHDTRLLAIVRVGRRARRRSRREPACQQFELPVERRAQELVDDAVREVEPPPARAPDDVVALA